MRFKAFYDDHRRLFLGLSSFIFLVGGWELLLTYVIPVNPFFFTKPSLIAIAFRDQIVASRSARSWAGTGASSTRSILFSPLFTRARWSPWRRS